jgi:hypothetical protein
VRPRGGTADKRQSGHQSDSLWHASCASSTPIAHNYRADGDGLRHRDAVNDEHTRRWLLHMNLSMFRLEYAFGQTGTAESGIDNVPSLVIETYPQGECVCLSHFPHMWTWTCVRSRAPAMSTHTRVLRAGWRDLFAARGSYGDVAACVDVRSKRLVQHLKLDECVVEECVDGAHLCQGGRRTSACTWQRQKTGRIARPPPWPRRVAGCFQNTIVWRPIFPGMWQFWYFRTYRNTCAHLPSRKSISKFILSTWVLALCRSVNKIHLSSNPSGGAGSWDRIL